MSLHCVGSWHIRPTSSEYEGRSDVKKTWAGPISTKMYSEGINELSKRTNNNIQRLSLQMQKMDPCIEYGIKHWHLRNRPHSAQPLQRIAMVKSVGKWENVDVMFTNNKLMNTLRLSVTDDDDTDTYIDLPTRNTFCYLCSTMEEHQRHMLLHRPKRKIKSAKPRICFIAPIPKQKHKEDNGEEIYVKKRLYKIEVFTSDVPNSGTNANIFITIKGSLELLPRTQLKKKQGCCKPCFLRASKEVFSIKGPYLGTLEILTIEHDGKKRFQGWHLEKIEVTDMKTSKTWVFYCGNWLSIYEKPLFSNKVDLNAEERQSPMTDYTITVYTGKPKLAGTDANISITLFGQYGQSKKILLADSSTKKKLFERKSIDNFQIRIHSVGELKRIRVEHDGTGFASGWFLDKIVIKDSERPKDTYYFTYGGWIAVNEGDGSLWREITAKKSLPKEIHAGTDTKYTISVKTGDIRFAGTDANVFIQIVGANGATPKLTLDNSKDNFEQNMVDDFELRSINSGPIKNIVIGHDNTGVGPGWFLEQVTVRRHIPKDEAHERLKRMKKRLNVQQKIVKDDKAKQMQMKDKEKLYSVSSSEDSSEAESKKGSKVSANFKKDKRKKLVEKGEKNNEKDKGYFDEDDHLQELKVPLYEDCLFVCNKWLAADEEDGLLVREFPVTKRCTYYKEH